MKILSIDVGLKNLAICILKTCDEKPYYDIEYWKILNLCEESIQQCCNITNGKSCSKLAKFFKDGCYYCKQHASKTEYSLPTSELNKYKRYKIDELKTLVKEYKIETKKPETKTNLILSVEEYIKMNVLETVSKTKCSDYNLIDIGKIIKQKLDEKLDRNDFDLDEIDIILIENQISPIANRMAILQGMITQYFLMKNKYNIKFISGTNKLKLFIGSRKTKYNERKKISIEITNNLINNLNCDSLDYYYSSKKRDDLADCFLQAIWYLTNEKIIII